MSHIKGLLKKEQLEDFKTFLTGKGIGWVIPKSPYAPLQVIKPGNTAVLSIDKHDTVGIPESLRTLVMEFLATPTPVTDSERLVYLLSKPRKVVVERVSLLAPGQHFEIYVEIGVMGEDRAPAVKFSIPENDSLLHYSVALTDKKRQAIDLAIKYEK